MNTSRFGMRQWSSALLVAGVVLSWSAASQAAEHEGEFPVSYVERPLTLPRMTLNPELEFGITKPEADGAHTEVDARLGARFGVTDDFQVGAWVLPLLISPDFKYGNPSVDALYRFVSGDVEVGGYLGFGLIRGELGGWVANPGIPVRFRPNHTIRLDTGLFVPLTHWNGMDVTIGGVTATSDAKTYVGLNVPLRVAFEVADNIHIGANTGLGAWDLGHFKETLTIPLGIFAGYVVADGKRPLLDIDPFFQWGSFLTPGSEGDKVHVKSFTVGLAVAGFFYL